MAVNDDKSVTPLPNSTPDEHKPDLPAVLEHKALRWFLFASTVVTLATVFILAIIEAVKLIVSRL